MGGVAGAIGAIGGGLLQSRSASKAADAQTAAAQAQINQQQEFFDQIRSDLGGYRDAGGNALAALSYDLGLTSTAPVFGGSAPDVVEFQDTVHGAYNPNGGRSESRGRDSVFVPVQAPDRQVTKFRVNDQVFSDRDAAQDYANANPVGGETYGGWQTSPGYDFRLDQALDAVESRAAANGSLLSGATLAARDQRAQDYASDEYGMHINRLAQLAGMGQSAAGMTANAGTNFAQMGSNALANMGNAQAAGAIGQGNAWTGALNNLAGMYGYQQGNNSRNNASLFGFWN